MYTFIAVKINLAWLRLHMLDTIQFLFFSLTRYAYLHADHSEGQQSFVLEELPMQFEYDILPVLFG